MPPDPPKLIVSLAFETFVVCFLVIASGLWLASIGNSSGLFGVFGAAVLALVKIRSASTRITKEGVSQLTLRGRVHLSWNEVTQVTPTPFGLALAGVERRVVVSAEEFADSSAVKSYVESHLPLNLRISLTGRD